MFNILQMLKVRTIADFVSDYVKVTMTIIVGES